MLPITMIVRRCKGREEEGIETTVVGRAASYYARDPNLNMEMVTLLIDLQVLLLPAAAIEI